MKSERQAFKAISRIVLINWHYIDFKVLNLNENINFFTGHSGSGKSTVIDAMQIVLYANTDGRGFFNKAAADDSDRSLMEYLRGMITIGENGQAEYKRNSNFSTVIVLELEQTMTQEKECVGVLLDVDTAANDFNRIFFYHKGGIPEHFYRKGGRALTIQEWKGILHREYEKEDYFYTSNNERFRRNLYDIYLGGLDMEKFPRLFKRAIPFRMNIRLEDFVKEYICMEQDLHIEQLQENVILYGRMCRKIEETQKEADRLKEVDITYQKYQKELADRDRLKARCKGLSLKKMQQDGKLLEQKIAAGKEELAVLKAKLEEEIRQRQQLAGRYDELNRNIAGSDYGVLEDKRRELSESVSLLERSRKKWEETAGRLAGWEEEESASNQILWDIEKFQKGTVSGEELSRLKKNLEEVKKEAFQQRQEAAAELRAVQKESNLVEQDLSLLKSGKKAYPRELEQAQRLIGLKLYEKYGKEIPVRILADLLEIRNEKWRNAIEGYLGSNKLALTVEPSYVKDAMEILEQMTDRKYSWIALVDTERILKENYTAREGSLAMEVETTKPYVQAYIRYLLGRVQKCENLQELRNCTVGVTADCFLYRGYQLRRMKTENYTQKAYIGEQSMRSRQKKLQEKMAQLEEKRKEYEEQAADADRILGREFLEASAEEYLYWLRDIEEKKKKEEQIRRLDKSLEQIGTQSVDIWKQELEETAKKQLLLEKQIDECKLAIHDKEAQNEKREADYLECSKEQINVRTEWEKCSAYREEFLQYLKEQKNADYGKLLQDTEEQLQKNQETCLAKKEKLIEARNEYLKQYPERGFSINSDDNEEYDTLLKELACDRLEEFRKKAADQAGVAVEHFKEDFVYKIRSAIKEAYVRMDELNRIIRNLNFGKDRYQFRITGNKGSYGRYYNMFMDESLDIRPGDLSGQLDLFALEHEKKYGPLMEELLSVFIPPENAGAKEQEEALENIRKYSDYRTYLSFEMEQIVEGEDRLVIGLSRMIKKNSGGEGQNPLYIALLASFAQAYRIQGKNGTATRPAIRLVVLDEAFSKMDAEKVASCIELIRGLGFQAIISATNDKIQNYLENVDKTFVFANPNKKSISIQEFERKDFEVLSGEE